MREHSENWRAEKKGTAPATLVFYRGSVKKFLTSLGERADADICEVEAKAILAYRNELISLVSPKTVNHDMKTVKALFKAARRNQLLVDDPTEFIEAVKGRANASRRPCRLNENHTTRTGRKAGAGGFSLAVRRTHAKSCCPGRSYAWRLTVSGSSFRDRVTDIITINATTIAPQDYAVGFIFLGCSAAAEVFCHGGLFIGAHPDDFVSGCYDKNTPDRFGEQSRSSPAQGNGSAANKRRYHIRRLLNRLACQSPDSLTGIHPAQRNLCSIRVEAGLVVTPLSSAIGTQEQRAAPGFSQTTPGRSHPDTDDFIPPAVGFHPRKFGLIVSIRVRNARRQKQHRSESGKTGN
jgi:hypothetical protein